MNIQEFSFGNFKSFKEIQTLNLSAAKIRSGKKEMEINNVIQGSNNQRVSFLKSKAIYGANASGKSNVINAFVSFIRIVGTSVKDDRALQLTDSFKLSTETENEPGFFQIIFWHEGRRYRYGFEADHEKITAEWLYGKPNDRELPFFIRDNQRLIELDKTNFSEGNKLISLLGDDLEENEVFRPNSLFLSTLATFGFGRLSRQLVDSLTSVIVINGLGHQGMDGYVGDALDDGEKKRFVLDFLKHADIGIEDFNAIRIPPDDLPEYGNQGFGNGFEDKKRKLIMSTRKKFDANLVSNQTESFAFGYHESEGTQRLFELSPFLYEALSHKIPIVIDELDARFHPLLTRKIVELFNSKENTGSQLIFTTHDTNLLSSELLRRDQIEFVEKDKFGASRLYSLTQFKGIRITASFEKDYMQGKYGAVPLLGDFRGLINSEEEHT